LGAFLAVSPDVFIGCKKKLLANRKQGEPLALLVPCLCKYKTFLVHFQSSHGMTFTRVKIEDAKEKCKTLSNSSIFSLLAKPKLVRQPLF
jgi:hypothetical protein